MPLVIGKHAFLELLHHSPHKIIRVYLIDAKQEFIKLLNDKHIEYKVISKDKLDNMSDKANNQGVVVEIKERVFLSLSDFFQHPKDKSLVLMADSINDAQNFGAIARLSDCFGVDALVFSKNRGTDITPFAAKAASGAFEFINLIRVSNLYDTVLKFKDEGYSTVIADISPDSKELQDFTFPAKTLLIVGSEGFGVQPLIKKTADFVVRIPMKGRIDSLNVSQATAIFLFKALIVK